jgi:chemotaxis protein histidine kinase CheA
LQDKVQDILSGQLDDIDHGTNLKAQSSSHLLVLAFEHIRYGLTMPLRRCCCCLHCLQDKVQDILSGQLDDIDEKAVQDELRMLEEMAAAEEAAELPSPPTDAEQQKQKAAAEAAAAAAAAAAAEPIEAEAELEELPSVPQTKVSLEQYSS